MPFKKHKDNLKIFSLSFLFFFTKEFCVDNILFLHFIFEKAKNNRLLHEIK